MINNAYHNCDHITRSVIQGLGGHIYPLSGYNEPQAWYGVFVTTYLVSIDVDSGTCSPC